MATVPNPTLFLKTHSSAGVVEIAPPTAGVKDYADPVEKMDFDANTWDALGNPLIAIAATLLFALLFVIAWVGGA